MLTNKSLVEKNCVAARSAVLVRSWAAKCCESFVGDSETALSAWTDFLLEELEENPDRAMGGMGMAGSVSSSHLRQTVQWVTRMRMHRGRQEEKARAALLFPHLSISSVDLSAFIILAKAFLYGTPVLWEM